MPRTRAVRWPLVIVAHEPASVSVTPMVTWGPVRCGRSAVSGPQGSRIAAGSAPTARAVPHATRNRSVAAISTRRVVRRVRRPANSGRLPSLSAATATRVTRVVKSSRPMVCPPGAAGGSAGKASTVTELSRGTRYPATPSSGWLSTAATVTSRRSSSLADTPLTAAWRTFTVAAWSSSIRPGTTAPAGSGIVTARSKSKAVTSTSPAPTVTRTRERTGTFRARPTATPTALNTPRKSR